WPKKSKSSELHPLTPSAATIAIVGVFRVTPARRRDARSRDARLADDPSLSGELRNIMVISLVAP
ncbi:MAG: hypothetical protein AAF909_09360, partial [Pseudomonadota bacterium]